MSNDSLPSRRPSPFSFEMARILELIGKYGPDINEISRQSGQFKETVRYRYKEKLLKKGMVIQASPDEAALGLCRLGAKVYLARNYASYARQIFWAMHELCYLSGFELALPRGYYLIQASVPIESKADFKSILLNLLDIGIFSSVELFEFDWFRRLPMRAEWYNFDTGRWDYDWQAPVHVEDRSLGVRSKTAMLDTTDLLILKELQIDASKTLSEIREALRSKNTFEIKYKTLSWHYRWHVLEHGMIKNYVVRWLGTKYDHAAGRAEQRVHRYVIISLLVRDVTEMERVGLMGQLSRTPFLWAEAAGKDYFAQCAFPIEMTTEGMEYLRQVMRRVRNKAEYHISDQKNAVSFSVNPRLWDDINKKWRCDRAEVIGRFQNLVLKINRDSAPNGS